MTDAARRIAAITLEAANNGGAPGIPELEVERHKAVSDLLVENVFEMKAAAGPYRLALSMNSEDIFLAVLCDANGHNEDIRVPARIFRQHFRDYKILCENFYKTARAGEMHKLEAIDAGRRSIHDEGAEALAEALEDKVLLDKMTARRLFTLIYVLHARAITN